MRSAIQVTLIGAAIGLAACEQRPTNFSQYPGFRAYFAANPPSTTPPSAAERALLHKYRPRLWIAAGQEGPIDFYGDYIAHGTLTDGNGKVVSRSVTRAVLNQYKSAPRAVFVHRQGKAPPTPVAYGRIDRGRRRRVVEIDGPECRRRDVHGEGKGGRPIGLGGR